MGQVDVSDVLTSLSAALCAGRHTVYLPDYVPLSTWIKIRGPWVNEHNIYCERLENVGDGIAGALVTARIYEKFTSAGAGTMTVMKQAAVSNVIFALILELADYSISDIWQRYDEMSVRDRTAALLTWGSRICKEAYCKPAQAAIKALGDRFEALLGYVYIEVGFEAALRWVNAVFDPLLDVAYATILARAPKRIDIPKRPRAFLAERPRIQRRSSIASTSGYTTISTSNSSSQSLSSSSSSYPYSARDSSTPSRSGSSPPSSPILDGYLPSSEGALSLKKRPFQEMDEPDSHNFCVLGEVNNLSSNLGEGKENTPSLLSRLQLPKCKRRRSKKRTSLSSAASLDTIEDQGEQQQFTFTFDARDSDPRPIPTASSSSPAPSGRLSVVPLHQTFARRRPYRQ